MDVIFVWVNNLEIYINMYKNTNTKIKEVDVRMIFFGIDLNLVIYDKWYLPTM